MSSVREAAANLLFEELVTAKDALTKLAANSLEQRRRDWGCTVKLDIQNVRASKAIMQATEKSVAAQREAEGDLVAHPAIFGFGFFLHSLCVRVDSRTSSYSEGASSHRKRSEDSSSAAAQRSAQHDHSNGN